MIGETDGERYQPDALASEKIVIGRKVFFLDLKENNRGRFLKITEDVGGRRDTIMVPCEVFDEFSDALVRLLNHSQDGDGR
jgi:hypothetical protein